MAVRMQQRRATAEQWLLADPVLAEGEIGLETDTSSFKIGNGADQWSELDYFETSAAIAGTIDDYVPLTQKGAPLGVATLDATGNVPSSQLGNVPVTDLTGYATETFVTTAVSNLVDSAPLALDTLNELAAALGDDSDFATTVTNAIAGKASAIHTHVLADITDYVEPDLLPSQAGNSGKFLSTDGTNVSWQEVNVSSIEDNYVMSLMGAI